MTRLYSNRQIFVINACRGKQEFKMQLKQISSDCPSSTSDDDVLSDCLIMYSCVEGHYSFRCSSEGRSPFMEQMSQVAKNL